MKAELSGAPLNLNDGRQRVMHDGIRLVGSTDPYTLSLPLPVSNRKRRSSRYRAAGKVGLLSPWLLPTTLYMFRAATARHPGME